MNDTHRQMLQAWPSGSTFPARLWLGLILIPLGIAASIGAFRIIGGGGAAVLLAMLLLLGGIVAAVLGILASIDASMSLGANRRDRANIDQALATGKVDITTVQADAAWSVAGLDDDAGAILFRIAPDRFLLINDALVDDLSRPVQPTGQAVEQDGNAIDPQSPPKIPARFQIVGCNPSFKVLAIEPEARSPWMVLRDNLPQATDEEVSDAFMSGDDDSYIMAELPLSSMPKSWRSILTDASNPPPPADDP